MPHLERYDLNLEIAFALISAPRKLTKHEKAGKVPFLGQVGFPICGQIGVLDNYFFQLLGRAESSKFSESLIF